MASGAGGGMNGGLNHGQDYLRAVRGITASSFPTEEDRMKALLATYEVISKLETPWDTYVRIHLNQSAVTAGVKVIKDLNLMMKWKEQGFVPMTSDQLAGLVGGCDPRLLHRFLRSLAANGLMEQIPVEKFQPNHFCMELAKPDFNTLTNFYYVTGHGAFGTLPDYLAETAYKDPSDATNTILRKSTGHSGDLWSYLSENPKIGEMFNIVQKASTNKEPPWMDMYPHRNLVDGSDPSLPLLVDIGGGIGHDLLRFYKAYPNEGSRLYLEDLQSVISDAEEKALLPDTVKKVEYSFFEPQPVKHARAYYMHHIIHDWPDHLALKILETQKSAMKPGYSRLLIHDQVLDDEKSQMNTTAFDIGMMVYLSGKERTEKQWLALLDSAGLRIIKFWKKPPDYFSVIEVEVPVS
ncbi:S-adenosyl-L-methionine-dependent methyltransferase [Colletotrichum godetiae]|uniref:S-adenosyl-L-methionine-dependent methyltransferase n=1 Tax=Colletotrichum godetiae TaxID=1209918 RepID=A0AAJ0AZR6_9PEZI|nr:S-adenosyl-L-methionine-dependent methyltransferase [Colletotrichum godetiae]KAK1700490.1 S-adenosyl-L-methionine-dependent methyltransferase [Colletotrichum godetiae]